MDFTVHIEGKILRSGKSSEADFLLQALEGESVIEGASNPNTQMILDGAVVDKPPVLPPPVCRQRYN